MENGHQNPKTLNPWKTLRMLPTEPFERIIDKVSTSRYKFASQFARGQILDIACGAGYGSHYLSEKCMQVIGADLGKEAARFARKKYGGNSNLCFLNTAAQHLPFKSQTFDTVISLETIEHMTEQDGRRFLADVWRVLKIDGIFILSTPNRYEGQRGDRPLWRWHLREYDANELKALLKINFKNTAMYGQMMPEIYAFDRKNRGKPIYRIYGSFPKQVRDKISDIKYLVKPDLLAYHGPQENIKIFFSTKSIEESCNLLAICRK